MKAGWKGKQFDMLGIILLIYNKYLIMKWNYLITKYTSEIKF